MTETQERIWTMDDIVTADTQNGGKYFSKDTMRWWGSRLCHSSVRQGQGGIFFVISNKQHRNERVYRVAMWCPVEMIVKTAPYGNWRRPTFTTLRSAIAHAQYLANEDKVTRVKRMIEEQKQDN